MSFLLDTHVWIWSQQKPENFGNTARKIIKMSDRNIFISTISTLELARLVQVGVIVMTHSLTRWVNRSLELLHCGTIEVSHKIAVEVLS